MAELFVVGRLDGSQNFPGGGSLYCRWKAEYGSAWRLLEGDEVGRTQVDTPADGQRCVWSHPLGESVCVCVVVYGVVVTRRASSTLLLHTCCCPDLISLLELHFATKSMQGWPKLVLEVWRLDAFGRHDLCE